MSTPSSKPKNAQKKIALFITLFCVVIGAGLYYFQTIYVRQNIAQAYKFPSDSMKPTLMKGDRLWANKAIYKESKPERGDIIVFRYPVNEKRDFVKRLIAFEGETVEIINGHILINDNMIDHPVISKNYYYNGGEFGKENTPVHVPPGHYFVLGDNSRASSDSRIWGFVPHENVEGKVAKIYWPPERSGAVK